MAIRFSDQENPMVRTEYTFKRDINDDYRGPEHCTENYCAEIDRTDGSRRIFYENSRGIRFEVWECEECGEFTQNKDCICDECKEREES